MHIADAILHANSAGVIYFLLTSYIEAVRHDELKKALPDICLGGEYKAVDQVARCLDAVLQRAGGSTGRATATVIDETVAVLRAAVMRLRHLEPGAQSTRGGG